MSPIHGNCLVDPGFEHFVLKFLITIQIFWEKSPKCTYTCTEWRGIGDTNKLLFSKKLLKTLLYKHIWMGGLSSKNSKITPLHLCLYTCILVIFHKKKKYQFFQKNILFCEKSPKCMYTSTYGGVYFLKFLIKKYFVLNFLIKKQIFGRYQMCLYSNVLSNQ